MARRHPYSCVCYCGSSITFVKMAAGPKPVTPSRRRDCHLTAPPCTFIRCFNRVNRGCRQMTVSPTASHTRRVAAAAAAVVVAAAAA